jgi:signal transduction histidine kinase
MTSADRSSSDDRLATVVEHGQDVADCDSITGVATVTVKTVGGLDAVTAATVVALDGDEPTVLAATDGDVGTDAGSLATRAVDERAPVSASDLAAETAASDGATLAIPAVVTEDSPVAVVASTVGDPSEATTALLVGLSSRAGSAIAARRLREERAIRRNQTERLERVATLVNHDLKTPLDVVGGQLDMAQGSGDDRHFELVRTALDQIDDIVEGSVTLARQGQYVEDREELDVAALAETTWGHVDTGEATLAVETTRTVEGDKMRLLRSFEKLFENAVAHAGPNVTVTVADCQDGFYVADDGPGIPETSREQVFEPGYSTTEAPGYGLAVAAACVDAHSWDLSLADSASGGARFEITGTDG